MRVENPWGEKSRRNRHGGNAEFLHAHSGKTLMDFSASVTPFGLSEEALAAAGDALFRVDRYPDPTYQRLRIALGETLDIDPDWVIPGCGASDLIGRFFAVLRGKCIAIPIPSFSEYIEFTVFYGCRIKEIPLRKEDGFQMTGDALPYLKGADGMVICNPNNPSGTAMNQETLDCLLCAAKESGCRVLLDECFLDFVENGRGRSLLSRLEEFPNVLVVRSLTKTHGLAGLRVGYGCCADPLFRQKFWQAGIPWCICAPAEAAAIAALKEEDKILQQMKWLGQERERVRRWLFSHYGVAPAEHAGLSFLFGEANFLFFCNGLIDYGKRMEKEGILLRDCSSFSALPAGCWRVAIRTKEENDCLLTAMCRVDQTYGGRPGSESEAVNIPADGSKTAY